MSLQRQIERRARITLGEKHPKLLDDLNNKLYKEANGGTFRQLHATKGWRRFSPHRLGTMVMQTRFEGNRK